MEKGLTMSDDYAAEVARLRAQVQGQLAEGTEPTLTSYEQLLLCGWYERELGRLERQAALLGGSVDDNYAARLDAERATHAAVTAMDRALTGTGGRWEGRAAGTSTGDAPR